MRKAAPKRSKEKVTMVNVFSEVDIPMDLFSNLSEVKRETNNPAKAKMSIIEAPAQCMVLKKIPEVASASISPLKIGFDFILMIVLGVQEGEHASV
jgi:hypothetical protein